MPFIEVHRQGELRHQIVIERDVTAKSGSGAAKPWTTTEEVYTLRAKIVLARVGGEAFNPDWSTSRTRYRVTIHHRTGITPDMRVNFGGRHLAIRQVPVVSKADQFITLECEEVI